VIFSKAICLKIIGKDNLDAINLTRTALEKRKTSFIEKITIFYGDLTGIFAILLDFFFGLSGIWNTNWKWSW
jgi:hypothetical protein